jgi:hypothetical protein
MSTRRKLEKPHITYNRIAGTEAVDAAERAVGMPYHEIPEGSPLIDVFHKVTKKQYKESLDRLYHKKPDTRPAGARRRRARKTRRSTRGR